MRMAWSVVEDGEADFCYFSRSIGLVSSISAVGSAKQACAVVGALQAMSNSERTNMEAL
jgi:hypothetical protein